jgi:fluoroquinolone resistance protein
VELKAGAVFTGLDLSEVDFADADLTDAVFDDCTLRSVRLSNTVLDGAQFKASRLLACRFAHAQMREARFEDCVMSEAQSGCEFAFGRMEEVRFARCNLSFARFDRVAIYNGVFEACNLRGASFVKADFGRAFGRSLVRWAGSFAGSNLELADLAELRLPEGDFSRCLFREADLRDADLEGCDLRGSDLFQALTTGAKLARADLRDAEVSGLDLSRLASVDSMKVTADQQYRLLTALGVDVCPD